MPIIANPQLGIDVPNPFSGIDFSWLNPQRIAKLLIGIMLLFIGVFALLFGFVEQGVTKVANIKSRLGV
jgi:hypothetical protein